MIDMKPQNAQRTEDRDMSYPSYTRAERIADAAVHVLGVGSAFVAVAFLIFANAGQLSPGAMTAAVVYGIAMILMLSASAAYHLAAHTSLRPLLRRIDHAAIYVKIAGTITPLAVLLNTPFAYTVLTLVWFLALSGAVRKLLAARGKMSTHWLPQVALGWLGLIIIVPLWPSLPANSLTLIFAGGIIYSGAVVFYCWDTLKFSNAIWHACVLIATACCFFGIFGAMAHTIAAL
ncbi:MULTISPECIES: PAQR family membrane homeostasis protein TrhA [unclassified Roseovarius]|uniref:PAQR family membrane homeostasis protein TrhA n=2 Tax=Roseovarius TaxID=74030 RepID=UPI00273F5461|nr:hemolysin III family protein [Roseovarius sp. MMSF_3350]